MNELRCPTCAETIDSSTVVCARCGAVVCTPSANASFVPPPLDEPSSDVGGGSGPAQSRRVEPPSHKARVATGDMDGAARRAGRPSSAAIATAVIVGACLFGGGAFLALNTSVFGARDGASSSDSADGDEHSTGLGDTRAFGSSARPPRIDQSIPRNFVCSSDVGALATALLGLPAGAPTTALRVHPAGHEKCLAVPAGTDAATTQALTSALGYSRVNTAWNAAAASFIARVSVERWAVLRASPDRSAAVVAQLPRGSVAMALIGNVEGHVSVLEPGNDRSWTFVALSDHSFGWLSGRWLRPFSGCTPTFEALRRVVHSSPAGDTFLIGTAIVSTASGPSHAVWLIERSHGTRQSNVSIFTLGPSCEPALVHSVVVGGWVADMQLVDAFSASGPTLVVMGTHPGPLMDPTGTETWTVTPIGATVPVFARQIPTGAAAGRDNRIDIETGVRTRPDGYVGYWPMRLKPAFGPDEFFEWQAGLLVSTFVTAY